MRWSKTNQSGYIDSPVFDYIYRPDELDDMCLYEFTSKYESISRIAISVQTESIYEFLNVHPSKQYKLLKKRSSECIPIIESSNLPNLCSLLSNDSNAGEREIYVKKAFLLFKPFRNDEDLYSTHNIEDSSYWTSFMSMRRDSTSTFWKTANEILQHHQDRCYNIQNVGRLDDTITRSTKLTEKESITTNEEHNVYNIDNHFPSSEEFDELLATYEDHSHTNVTNEDIQLMKPTQFHTIHYSFNIPFENRSILIDDDNMTSSSPFVNPSSSSVHYNPRQDNIIRIAIGSFLRIDTPDINTERRRRHTSIGSLLNNNIANMHVLATSHNLDPMQRKAFFCCMARERR